MPTKISIKINASPTNMDLLFNVISWYILKKCHTLKSPFFNLSNFHILRGIKTNPPPKKKEKKELGPTCAIYSGPEQ